MMARTLRLTRRGWALIWTAVFVVFVTTVMDRPEGLFVALFLVVVTVLCAVIVATQRTPVAVTRRVAANAHCAERLDVVCELRASGSAAAVSGWTDETPTSFGPAPRGVLPPERMLRSGRAAVTYRVIPTVRGIHEIGPFRVTVSDPLGVCEMTRAISGRTPVLVLPRISELAPSGIFTAANEGRRRDRTRPTAPRADELIARDYRQGDPLRRVHWRATARRGQLMVRQEEPQADPDAVLILDVPPGQTRIDACVDLAASISVHLAQIGFRVTVAFADERWITAPPNDPRELLTELAIWPGWNLERPRTVAQRCEQQFAERVPLVLVTTDADRLVELGDLARRAAPPIAFVASGTGLAQDAVPTHWLAAGLADRVDVAASWARLNRRLARHG